MYSQSITTVLSMIGIVHIVALVSPGPDFAMILRSCTQYGKRYALLSAIGLALGVSFHVSYSLLGLKLLINAVPYVLRVIAVLGALYFFIQGYKSILFAIRTKNSALNLFDSKDINFGKLTFWKAISNGFLTNALNPKAFVYFFSFFAATISNINSSYLGIIAGIEVILLTWGWFSLLAYIVSSQGFLKLFNKYNYFINFTIGIIFIIFSISMIVFAYR